jgi:hypothetical protein
MGVQGDLWNRFQNRVSTSGWDTGSPGSHPPKGVEPGTGNHPVLVESGTTGSVVLEPLGPIMGTASTGHSEAADGQGEAMEVGPVAEVGPMGKAQDGATAWPQSASAPEGWAEDADEVVPSVLEPVRQRPPHADAGPIQPSEVAEMACRWLAATLALVTAWRRGRP